MSVQSLSSGAEMSPLHSCQIPQRETIYVARFNHEYYDVPYYVECIFRIEQNRSERGNDIPTTHHNRSAALFPGPPGRAGARRELLDFMVQGKINRGRHTDDPAGSHSIRTNQCPPPPSPVFIGQMPFLPPNQQCQSTEGI